MRTELGLLVALILVVGLLVVPRLRPEVEDRKPPPAVAARAPSASDAELLALDRLPASTAEQIREARERWRAFAAAQPLEEYRVYAHAALRHLDAQLDRIARRDMSTMFTTVHHLRTSRKVQRARAVVADFERRYAGAPCLSQLRQTKHLLAQMSDRELLGKHHANFQRLGPGNTVPELEDLRLAKVRASGAGKGSMVLMRPGQSAVVFTFAIAERPQHAELQTTLIAALHQGVTDSAISIRINGQILCDEWRPRSFHGQLHVWPIAHYLRVGTNAVELALHRRARTACFIRDLAVLRYR